MIQAEHEVRDPAKISADGCVNKKKSRRHCLCRSPRLAGPRNAAANRDTPNTRTVFENGTATVFQRPIQIQAFSRVSFTLPSHSCNFSPYARADFLVEEEG